MLLILTVAVRPLAAVSQLLSGFPAIHLLQAGVSLQTQMLTASNDDTWKDIFSPSLFTVSAAEWKVL